MPGICAVDVDVSDATEIEVTELLPSFGVIERKLETLGAPTRRSDDPVTGFYRFFYSFNFFFRERESVKVGR